MGGSWTRAAAAPEAPTPGPQMSETQNNTPWGSPSAKIRSQSDYVLVEENVRLMVDLMGNVRHGLDDRPSTLVYLHLIAENDAGWLQIIEALIFGAPLHKPLATSAITMIFDSCPLPSVDLVLESIRGFQLCRERALSSIENEDAKCRERNTLTVLGCMAVKFAGSLNTKMLDHNTMEYLYTYLVDVKIPILVLYAVTTLEKFARSVECEKGLVAFFDNQEAPNPLIALESYYDSTDKIYQQVGFCARWLLDNIFVVKERALSYTTVDMSGTNAVLELRDSTDFLKISPDGLQARCDSNTFEFVRCTFQVVKGSWYYEAEVLTPGIMQIGWAAKDARFYTRPNSSDDDNFALSYDGSRRTLWHKSVPKMCLEVESWNAGDIIGCLIDVSKQEAIFSLNGERLPTYKKIFRSYRPSPDINPKRKQPFYAAASLSCFQSIRFNFGSREFRFAPVDRGFMDFNSHGTLTEKEKQIVPRRLHVKEIKALQADVNEDIDNICPICYDREIQSSAEPCHHMSFCYECVVLLKKCPVCRMPIWMKKKRARRAAPPRLQGGG